MHHGHTVCTNVLNQHAKPHEKEIYIDGAHKSSSSKSQHDKKRQARMLSDFSSGYFMPEVQQPNHQVNKTVAVGIQHSITYNISDIRASSHMSWSENSSTCMY